MANEFNELQRVANVDLDGNKSILFAMRKIKGISFSFANAVLVLAKVDKMKKSGYLTADEIKRIETVLDNPTAAGVPTWALNRRFDMETGEDRHIMQGDLKFNTENDRRRLQRIKSRRGLRLAKGLPVRGQRTRSNFRTKSGLGVKRKK